VIRPAYLPVKTPIGLDRSHWAVTFRVIVR
jgi:hypothetical protein